MKLPSNLLRALAALSLVVLGTLTVSAAGLYDQVPTGDPSFAQFRKLETWGLLPSGTVREPATRYEAAEWILKGQRRASDRGLIVVVQLEGDLDLSGPEVIVEHKDKAQPVADATPTTDGASSVESGTEPSPEEVKKTFQTLQEAYDYELGQIKGDVAKVKERLQKLEEQDYKVWRQVRGLSTNATISLHGFGRGYGRAARFYGAANPGLYRSYNQGYAFLDLEPTGGISKELRWSGILRMATNFASGNAGIGATLSRIGLQFNPSFLSATLGDFDLSWTPFTVWNRDGLDLLYKPEVISRWDDYLKYPLFMNHAPDLPFRGVRASTRVQWPKSKVMESFKIETFVHMIRNGFVQGYLPHRYTGWIFGAMSELKAAKYASLSAYGLMLDEPLNTDASTAVYVPLAPSSGAHRYQIGSIRPKLDFPLGADFSVGGELESAFTIYQDDKLDVNRKITDFAMIGGPRFKYQDSTLSINMMDVGYAFYSPLAQMRQKDDYTQELSSQPLVISGDPVNDTLGRAGTLFKYYNRLQDNVFPYGMATPNRKGIGAELDVKMGVKNGLRLKAQFYSVKEIRENETINSAGTGMTVLDAWGPVTVLHRKYQYINVGPRVDLASLWGLKHKLEVGSNYRQEQTTTTWGTLKGETLVFGITAGVASWLDLGAAGGAFTGRGVEVGYLGSPLARYSYRYDHTDLGFYEPFVVNQESVYGALSALITINRHSKLAVDGMVKAEKGAVGTFGTQKSQTVDVVYEVLF